MRLPICDSLFVAISLIIHLTHLISLTIVIINLRHYDSLTPYFYALLLLLTVFTFATNVLSLFWIFTSSDSPSNRVFVIILHVFQLGLIWRYFSLFAGERNDQLLKTRMCQVCQLRFVSSFCALGSSVLITLLILGSSVQRTPTLYICTVPLALLEFSWSMAAIGRKTRAESDQFVLSWPGVLAQTLWRFGTVSSRVAALSLYASVFTYFLFLVLGLHWLLLICTCYLLMNIFKQTVTTLKSVLFELALICLWSAVGCIDYINPSPKNTLQRSAAFYCLMVAENSLLTLIWLHYSSDTQVWHRTLAIATVWPGMVLGLFFMFIYYQCFHINVFKKTESSAVRVNSTFQCKLPFRLPKQPTKFEPPSAAPIDAFHSPCRSEPTHRKIHHLSIENVEAFETASTLPRTSNTPRLTLETLQSDAFNCAYSSTTESIPSDDMVETAF